MCSPLSFPTPLFFPAPRIAGATPASLQLHLRVRTCRRACFVYFSSTGLRPTYPFSFFVYCLTPPLTQSRPVSYLPAHSRCSVNVYWIHGSKTALAAVAQWIKRRPANQDVTGSIPSQGTCLGYRPGPQVGAHERQQHINVSLSFSLPFSLKIIFKKLKHFILRERNRNLSLTSQGRGAAPH